MPASILFRFLIPVLVACSGTALSAATGAPESPGESASARIDWSLAVHVSPEGNDKAPGTQQAPVRSIGAALRNLDPVKGGTVVLQGGIYREPVTIEAAEGTHDFGRLLLVAQPGEKPVFVGSRELGKESRRDDRNANVAIFQPGGLGLRPPEIWDADRKIRFSPVADLQSVEAFANSFCVLDAETLAIHEESSGPGSALRMNGPARHAMMIRRPNTEIRGIHFQDYVGSTWAGAISIRADDVTIADCHVDHAAKAFQVFTGVKNAVIEDCTATDVACGAYSLGIDTTVRNCRFISLNKEYMLDLYSQDKTGIQFYQPANGGTVENCVTLGFGRCGLYIKATSNDRSYRIEANSFTDGIQMGGGFGVLKQSAVTYRCNLVALRESAETRFSEYVASESNWASNVFYLSAAAHSDARLPAALADSNTLGENPFAGRTAAGLTVDAGIPSDSCARGLAGSSQKIGDSNLRIAAGEGEPSSKHADRKPTLLCTSSAQGVVIVIYGDSPGGATLRYREEGTQPWHSLRARDGEKLSINVEFVEIERAALPGRFYHHFALHPPLIKPGARYEYQVDTARGGGEQPAPELSGSFLVSGKARSIFVKAGAEGGDGTSESPFSTVQEAIDRALPGDTVMIAPGIYSQPALLMQGGRPGLPITLKGAGPDKTIFDSRKKESVLLSLSGAEHVTVENCTFRWFTSAGIAALDSPHLTIKNCRFLNHFYTERPYGYGVCLKNSREATVEGCLFTRLMHGLVANRSPGLSLLQNTAYANMYSGIWLIRSCEGSRLIGNSLAFNSNTGLRIKETDEAAFKSLSADFNNYACVIREIEKDRPELEIEPPDRYHHTYRTSKAIIGVAIGEAHTRFYSMKAWRAFSGNDSNSIYADPDYADPARDDFRLLPGSPNILEGGRVIGACPPVDSGLTSALPRFD